MVPPINYESKVATAIVEIDTQAEQKDDDVYGDMPSHRVPFIYVDTRDTIYIGSKDSHHVHVIYSIFDSNIPEEEQEMYNIEDDPGNMGVILDRGEILYWGEPKDQVIRAMQERFPDYPQKVYDWPGDLRFSRTAAFGLFPWVYEDGKIYLGRKDEHHPEMMFRHFPDRFLSDITWNDTERNDAIFGILDPDGEVTVYAHK